VRTLGASKAQQNLSERVAIKSVPEIVGCPCVGLEPERVRQRRSLTRKRPGFIANPGLFSEREKGLEPSTSTLANDPSELLEAEKTGT
jgi:hypothetical protein